MLSLHYLYSFHLPSIGNLPIAEICSNVHSLFIRSEASVINNHYQYKFSTHCFSYLSLMQMEINTLIKKLTCDPATYLDMEIGTQKEGNAGEETDIDRN